MLLYISVYCSSENVTTTPAPPPPSTTAMTLPNISSSDITEVDVDWSLIVGTSLITEEFELTVDVSITQTVSDKGEPALDFGGQGACQLKPTTGDCFGNVGMCSSLGFGFTYILRIKFTVYKEAMYFFSSGGELPDSCGMSFFYRYNKFQYVVSTTTSTWYAESESLAVDTWHEMAFSWEQSRGIEIYVNGSLLVQQSQEVSQNATQCGSNQELHIGSSVSINIHQVFGIFILEEFVFYNCTYIVLERPEGMY